MEGFLPVTHAIGWSVASLPFLVFGTHRLSQKMAREPQARLFLGASGGFAFVLSALKLPSVTGSCSHPTGIGLGTILFGPSIMCVLGCVVLVFQALFLAHGGLTTLGANTFSMAIVGSFTAWFSFRAARSLRVPFNGCVFLAAACSDLCTYLTTALQLALAFPDPASGLAGASAKFLGVFAFTQVPLAITEGLLTVLVMNLLRNHATDSIRTLLPAFSQHRK